MNKKELNKLVKSMKEYCNKYIVESESKYINNAFIELMVKFISNVDSVINIMGTEDDKVKVVDSDTSFVFAELTDIKNITLDTIEVIAKNCRKIIYWCDWFTGDKDDWLYIKKEYPVFYEMYKEFKEVKNGIL